MSMPSRRVLARYPCDLPVEVCSFLGATLVAAGRLRNLSLGGALLQCSDRLGRGVTYFLRFSWKQTALEFPGRVAWTGPHSPGSRSYGIQLNLTRDQEIFLRGILESLRSDAPAPAPRRAARDYWKPWRPGGT